MEQTDLILAILTVLSVFVGFYRGFCSEILKLAVYIFSGVLGYAFAPLLSPFMYFVPYKSLQSRVAVLFGTFIAFFILKILTSTIVSMIKRSCLGKLDRSLGAVFGALRAAVFLAVVYVVLFFGFPRLIASSRILTVSGALVGNMLASEEETEASPDQEEKEDEGWKTRLLRYLQNKKIRSEDGDRKLISVISSLVVENASDFVFEQESLLKEKLLPFSEEQKKRLMSELFEMNLTAWLQDKQIDEDELKEKVQNAIIEFKKEKVEPDENSGD